MSVSRNKSSLPIDYVLAYKVNDKECDAVRKAFEEFYLQADGITHWNEEFRENACKCLQDEVLDLKAILRAGLLLNRELVGVDYISQPFQRKISHLFVNYDDPLKFFRTALRSLLVHQILIEIDISKTINAEDSDEEIEFKKRGLLYLAMKGAYSDTFILHDPSQLRLYSPHLYRLSLSSDHALSQVFNQSCLNDIVQDEPYYRKMRERNYIEYTEFVEGLRCDPRKVLSKQWIPFYKFQPIHRIREYFGEKITFYFAWEGTFLTALWPAAVAGLLCFAYGLYHSVMVNRTNFDVCVRKDNFGQEKKDACTITENLHQIADLCLKAFDNALNPHPKNTSNFAGKIFSQVWNRNRSVLAYQWDANDYVVSEPDRPQFFGTQKEKDPITGQDEWIYPMSRRYCKLIVSALIVFMCMLVAIASVIAVILYKLFAASQFGCNRANNVILSRKNSSCETKFLYPLLEESSIELFLLENHRTNSEYNNALIVKRFAFQFVNTYTSLFYLAFIRPEYYGLQKNGLFGFGADYKDTCDYGTCGSLLALQLLSHMIIKPIPKFCQDIVLPLRWNRKIAAISENGSEQQSRRSFGVDEEQESNRLVREWMKPDVGDFTLGEYMEKILQFGSIMVLAEFDLHDPRMKRLFEIIPTDYCKDDRMIMFAPLFPLAPLIALVIGLCDIRIDARRLTWFNRRPVAFIANSIGIWKAIINFLQYIAVITNTFIVAFTSDFCDDLVSSPLTQVECNTRTRLLIALIFQNVVYASEFLIESLIPEVPSGIRLAQRRVID
ncbi:unnamed protein product [Anisakis simplex]|uniref:Anoctamin n=1 Tax=Anisakis simplex TaxID=6269 RepID=A0A0M3K4Q7_ANISI|nr:unnamed protein product [Anisakis simplex]